MRPLADRRIDTIGSDVHAEGKGMKKIIPKGLLLIIIMPLFIPVEAVALNCLSVIKEKEKSSGLILEKFPKSTQFWPSL